MALIKCPECKKKISKQADKCPYCGHPVQTPVKKDEPGDKKISASRLAWFFAIWLIAGIIIAILSLSYHVPAFGIPFSISLIALPIAYLAHPGTRSFFDKLFRVEKKTKAKVWSIVFIAFGILSIYLSSSGLVGTIQTRSANKELNRLIRDAKAAIASSNVPHAIEHLQRAISLEHATNQAPARRLLDACREATSERKAIQALRSMPDNEFSAFKDSGTLPSNLRLSDPNLNSIFIGNLQAGLPRAEILREQDKKRQEAERKAREEKQKQITREKAEKERQEKLAREKAERESRRQAQIEEAKKKQDFDKYIDALSSAGYGGLVENVRLDNITRNQVIITVKNSWHYQPKQVRLQHAQALWEAWARIRCLRNNKGADDCRIKIVDLSGNKVGGSGLFGGGSIKVND